MFNFPYQCGTSGDDPGRAAQKFEHEFMDGDVVLLYTDGYHDNIYSSGMSACIEKYLTNGVVTSLSGAADCQARKAYWLGLNQWYKSPFEMEMKKDVEAGKELPFGLPPNY